MGFEPAVVSMQLRACCAEFCGCNVTLCSRAPPAGTAKNLVAGLNKAVNKLKLAPEL